MVVFIRHDVDYKYKRDDDDYCKALVARITEPTQCPFLSRPMIAMRSVRCSFLNIPNVYMQSCWTLVLDHPIPSCPNAIETSKMKAMEKVLHLVVRQSPRVPPTSGSHRTNCIYYHSAFFHPRAQYQRGLVWSAIFWVKNVRKKLSISDTFSSNTNTDTEKVCVLQIQRQRQRKDADKYKIAFWPNARHTSLTLHLLAAAARL